MGTYHFETVDVFTASRFSGNPLAVFIDARGLDGAAMQALAGELNLSETTFVLPAKDPNHSARVRIFNRTAEMAFAGHPMIGTAYVLARRGFAAGGRLALEVPAGVAVVDIHMAPDGCPIGGAVEVPQPLTLGGEIPVADIAACLGIEPTDIRTNSHRPIVATVGNPYIIAELEADALGRCEPDRTEFRRALAAHPRLGERFSIHVYTLDGERVRARMFAPLAGTWEDPATGSANAPLAGLLLSLNGGERLRIKVEQGIEMGRPSLIDVEARVSAEGIRCSVSGSCVPVFTGAFASEGKG